jgi:hypothetical protein
MRLVQRERRPPFIAPSWLCTGRRAGEHHHHAVVQRLLRVPTRRTHRQPP